MNTINPSAVGQRIKQLRKSNGLSQTELAKQLNKSLRTVQKYETGEIEVSISVVNQLAKLLDTTPTAILGYEVKQTPIHSFSDVINLLFQLDRVPSVKFDIDVKKPSTDGEWSCSLRFDGKNADADFNADMCLFLEQWEDLRENLRNSQLSPAKLHMWQEQTLAYYAGVSVDYEEETTDETSASL